MAVSFVQKTKGAVVAKGKSELDLKVERIISLKALVDAAKKTTDEYEKIRKELVKLSDEMGEANEQVTFTSEVGDVVFSPKSFKRGVSDMKKLFDMLGEETFLKVCSVSMEDVDKYLGKAEQGDVIGQTLTGPRKITVVPKEVSVAEAA